MRVQSKYDKDGFSVKLFAIGMPSGNFCASYEISVYTDGRRRLVATNIFLDEEFKDRPDAMRSSALRADKWIAGYTER